VPEPGTWRFCVLSGRGGGYRRKRKHRIDYNEEIPFEKQPPLGFHDTAEDARDAVPHNFKRMRHQEVMGEKRDDIEQVSK
jgi:pre-mRNA-splicing factor CDC5/CEF1